jgi:hypothetical protein
MLSIDVGIRNCAYCFFETPFEIKKWDVIDLSVQKTVSIEPVHKEEKCSCSCKAVAKFRKNDTYFCARHLKSQPDNKMVIDSDNFEKMKLSELVAIAKTISDTIPEASLKTKTKTKKENIDHIRKYYKQLFYVRVQKPKKKSAASISLITIGHNLKENFDSIFDDGYSVDTVVIENQMSPVATRMKTIQGMIAQYFITKQSNVNIVFASSSNKLKIKEADSDIKTYSKRKQQSVSICKDKLVETNSPFLEFFNESKKKDDLSDCYLQGIYWLSGLK